MRNLFTGIALTAAALLAAPQAMANEAPQEWTLVAPNGVIEQAQIEPAKRITSLDGKTIALRWNAKSNGDVLLDYLATKLAKQFPTAKIVKTYKDDPSLNGISGSAAESMRIAKAVAAVKPDLVIASQCD